MAKLVATEMAQRVVDRAVQIHGGQGVMQGATVERLYREVRALRIYEGTSEIQKLVIARDMLKEAEASERQRSEPSRRQSTPATWGGIGWGVENDH